MKKRYIGGYLLATLATVFSIFFLDRAMASFAYENQLRGPLFEAMTWTADLLQFLTALLLIACLRKSGREAFGSLVKTLLLAFLFAWVVRLFAKYAFGRTWPDTWINDNPSWLQNGIEGFYPFIGGEAYRSFPSGHALITFALATVFWQAFPRFRWFWALSCLSVVIGMLGQYYHYPGDLLAGATLGCACGHLAIVLKNKA